EALGAIGSDTAVNILKKYATDQNVEIAETCQLALDRIEWVNSEEQEQLPESPYPTVDPAPAAKDNNVESLRKTLLDDKLSMFERYRAMFALRNKGCKQSVLALAEGLGCSSILFRHEIAYALGQMENEGGANQLIASLQNSNESPLVRHECATALAAIGRADCVQALNDNINDGESVVSESCELGLNMYIWLVNITTGIFKTYKRVTRWILTDSSKTLPE
ncbi:deoxyhypusine hydroxylase-like, partial [Saccoglossus kowalevskii]